MGKKNLKYFTHVYHVRIIIIQFAVFSSSVLKTHSLCVILSLWEADAIWSRCTWCRYCWGYASAVCSLPHCTDGLCAVSPKLKPSVSWPCSTHGPGATPACCRCSCVPHGGRPNYISRQTVNNEWRITNCEQATVNVEWRDYARAAPWALPSPSFLLSHSVPDGVV